MRFEEAYEGWNAGQLPQWKWREQSALSGMMIRQGGSTHEWMIEQKWDLIVTMDDATSWHYSMFFVDEEGTMSSFRDVHDVIVAHGLFSSFYSDRGSHYWTTPEADGKVNKENLTQFGHAMQPLGIRMIPPSPSGCLKYRYRCCRLLHAPQATAVLCNR